MTDLAYCYTHMTDEILNFEDQEETCCKEELPDEPLEIPKHMVPPNPDDCIALPCNVHPSYPYGDPTSLGHPAARPRTQGDPASRALFEDVMVYGVEPFNGTLRWHELALDQLLPVDEQKAEAERAAQARTVAPGISPSHAHGPPDEEEDEEADDSTEQVEEEE